MVAGNTNTLEGQRLVIMKVAALAPLATSRRTRVNDLAAGVVIIVNFLFSCGMIELAGCVSIGMTS